MIMYYEYYHDDDIQGEVNGFCFQHATTNTNTIQFALRISAFQNAHNPAPPVVLVLLMLIAMMQMLRRRSKNTVIVLLINLPAAAVIPTQQEQYIHSSQMSTSVCTCIVISWSSSSNNLDLAAETMKKWSNSIVGGPVPSCYSWAKNY